MIVCIAEKPSVAKDIARILGATKPCDGFMGGQRLSGYMDLRSSMHPERARRLYALWKRWSLSALPMLPQRFGIKLIDDAGIRKQFSVIEKLMQAADSIINCGDAGQEGELIQRWVMQKLRPNAPSSVYGYRR